MSPRPRADRCTSCGGTEFVQAVDNDGRSYPGCARCIVCLPAGAIQAPRLLRLTAALDALVAEYLVAHPSALPGTTSVLALLEWNAERLRAVGVDPGTVPAALWNALGRERGPVVHPDLVHFDLRRPYREWPETVRALIAERQREAGEVRR